MDKATIQLLLWFVLGISSWQLSPDPGDHTRTMGVMSMGYNNKEWAQYEHQDSAPIKFNNLSSNNDPRTSLYKVTK